MKELSGARHTFQLQDRQASAEVLKRQVEDKLRAKTRLMFRVSMRLKLPKAGLPG